MSNRLRLRFWLALGAVAVIALVAVTAVILLPRGGNLPPGGGDNSVRPGSEIYREMVSAFYTGVTALDVDANDQARVSLTQATELVPEEPAAWANRGLLKIRLGDYDGAAMDLEQARTLAPDNGAVEQLLALLEERRGRTEEAITHLRRAAELSPKDLKSRFALAQQIERLGEPDSDAQALSLMNEMAALRPDNVEILRERARLAAKRDDAVALEDSVARLGRLASQWPPKAKESFRELEKATKVTPRTAVTRTLFQRHLASLRNLLVQTPAFRQSLAVILGAIGRRRRTHRDVPEAGIPRLRRHHHPTNP